MYILEHNYYFNSVDSDKTAPKQADQDLHCLIYCWQLFWQITGSIINNLKLQDNSVIQY